MRRILLIPLVLLISSCAVKDAYAPVVGDWKGKLVAGQATLTIVVHLQRKDGALTGTMDSPDQKAIGVPITTVQFQDPALTFQVGSIGGNFSGKLSGNSLTGKWNQSGLSLPLTLSK